LLNQNTQPGDFLRTLEEENAKLKQLLAEAMLDNAMLKDIASKTVTSVARRRPWLTSVRPMR
jgi:putative transposase